MPAPVIAFDSAEAPCKRAEQLFARFREIYEAVSLELRALGCAQSAQLGDLWRAGCDLRSHHERRTGMAERTLRFLLASNSMTDDLRQRALAVLAGKQKSGTARDPHLLTELERTMVRQYRGMDPAAKQMIRTLFERLAATSGASEGER